jgi:hypothetical protein
MRFRQVMLAEEASLQGRQVDLNRDVLAYDRQSQA